jgi:hypothetical protein
VTKSFRLAIVALISAAPLISSGVHATVTDTADVSIRRFLAQGDVPHAYRASRRLEAENGDRKGWVEARTEYSPLEGMHYEITAQGGSSFIRARILRAVLDGEREMVAHGETARSALAPTNYVFSPRGVGEDGLANVLLSPRRKDPVLVAGTLFLLPADGNPVRLEGRLAKSPSFWVKDVDVVRTYQRIDGIVMPVGLESSAEIRLFGSASLHMTYTYLEIDGRQVQQAVSAPPSAAPASPAHE